MSQTLMPACIGAFALGAWWAYIILEKEAQLARYIPVVAGVAVTAFFLYLATRFYSLGPLFHEHTLVSLSSLGLIVFAIHFPDSFLHKNIFYKPLPILIGRISYGIYLYHNLVPWLLNLLIPTQTLDELLSGTGAVFPAVFKFTMRALFLFGLSWLSFKYIEKPVNDLKVRFK
ncbi:MAG: hypothetical protein LRY55_08430 [Leadbetterella sp.]|nr:hypothetical protein [Leadbetterella sp.]